MLYTLLLYTYLEGVRACYLALAPLHENKTEKERVYTLHRGGAERAKAPCIAPLTRLFTAERTRGYRGANPLCRCLYVEKDLQVYSASDDLRLSPQEEGARSRTETTRKRSRQCAFFPSCCLLCVKLEWRKKEIEREGERESERARTMQHQQRPFSALM